MAPNSTLFFMQTTYGAFVWKYSGIRIYSGTYSSYSAPGSRIAGMEIQVSRNRKSSQTNANLHYSKYSHSGLIPNERTLNCFTRSKLGLQNCLNKLSSHCKSWMLNINPKKTKIMIFQRRTKRYDYAFYVGNEKIDIIQDYTYLGTRISSSGNFTLSLEHL